MRKTVLILVIVLVAICGVGGYAMKGAMARMQAQAPVKSKVKVTRGDLTVSVIESGTVDATRSVDIKSRVTGRLKQLLVDEGDLVQPGQLIAVIDPKETLLRVRQDQAQVSGASSAVQRLSLQIAQRRKTAQAAYEQAVSRVHQLELEANAQPSLTRAAITQAETSLRTAQQEKIRLVQSSHPTQRMSAKSAVNEAQANFDNADREYKRQSELLDKGYVAGRTVESAKLSLDLAKVRLANTQEAYDKLDAQLNAELGKADDQVRQAQAALSTAKINSIQNGLKREDYIAAKAALATARAALSDPAIMEQEKAQSLSTVSQLGSALEDSRRQLNETDITTPIGGVVTKKGLQVGELATGLSQFSSGSTIVKVEDRRHMRVKLDVNEIDVARMRVGMPADVDVDALPDTRFTGIVRKIAPASKDASATGQSDAVVRFEVEIELTNPSPALRSGMTAKCTVNVIDHKNVLLLPLEYVRKDKRRYLVYIAPKTKTGKPEERVVTIGAASGSNYEITSGLIEGDEVVKPDYKGPERKGMMQMGPDDQ